MLSTSAQPVQHTSIQPARAVQSQIEQTDPQLAQQWGGTRMNMRVTANGWKGQLGGYSPNLDP